MESINLVKFLSDYYGIVCNDFRIKKLSHYDIKELFPNIVRTSFEYLDKNLSEVYRGEIILVYDCKGVILPYINPHLENVNKDEYDCDIYGELEFIDIDDIDLSILSKDELLKLRQLLKENHQRYDERMVVNAIRNVKNHKVMQYKRDKEMLKGEEKYGKY